MDTLPTRTAAFRATAVPMSTSPVSAASATIGWTSALGSGAAVAAASCDTSAATKAAKAPMTTDTLAKVGSRLGVVGCVVRSLGSLEPADLAASNGSGGGASAVLVMG